MPQTITPIDILTSGGKHPDREQSPECTTAVRMHAAALAEAVSGLVDELGFIPVINSGFRTQAANKAIGGAAHSSHCTGEAVDLADSKGALAKTLLDAPGCLERHDLYMEDPGHTPGWVHLQTRPTASGKRVFKP